MKLKTLIMFVALVVSAYAQNTSPKNIIVTAKNNVNFVDCEATLQRLGYRTSSPSLKSLKMIFIEAKNPKQIEKDLNELKKVKCVSKVQRENTVQL